MERLTEFDRIKNIEESCNIWNKLKNKNKIVDVIINLKNEITGLTIKNEKLENRQNQVAIEQLDKVDFMIGALTYWDNDFEGWIIDLDTFHKYIKERIEELKG